MTHSLSTQKLLREFIVGSLLPNRSESLNKLTPNLVPRENRVLALLVHNITKCLQDLTCCYITFQSSDILKQTFFPEASDRHHTRVMSWQCLRVALC